MVLDAPADRRIVGLRTSSSGVKQSTKYPAPRVRGIRRRLADECRWPDGEIVMEAAQMATEALQRLLTVLETRAIDVDAVRAPAEPPILVAFQQLQQLDGWAKVTFERLCADHDDSWAMGDLHRSLEQAVGLHPQFATRLDAALRSQPQDGAVLPEQVSAVQFTDHGMAASL
jgi:hypothetical protein